MTCEKSSLVFILLRGTSKKNRAIFLVTPLHASATAALKVAHMTRRCREKIWVRIVPYDKMFDETEKKQREICLLPAYTKEQRAIVDNFMDFSGQL